MMRSSAVAPSAVRGQRRHFYLGQLERAWGRAHPASGRGWAKHINTPFLPRNARGSEEGWHRAWEGHGPLYYGVDQGLELGIDEQRRDRDRCFQRWRRDMAEERVHMQREAGNTGVGTLGER
eukprot:Hpha_TRINITY_DN12384_c0_g1::TRINITY_DN12384_c0_g1_i1::g.155812::m.155812